MYHQHLFVYLLSMFSFLSLCQSKNYTNKFLDCAATSISCGSYNFSISYPLRLPSMPAYCGHPKFEVQCIDHNSSNMVISIMENKYRVHLIHYDMQFIGVSNLDYAVESCPHKYSNTSIDYTLYHYFNNVINMTLYCNCSPFVSHPNIRKIPCLSNISTNSGYRSSYYSLPKDNPPILELTEKCSSTVLIPVYEDDDVDFPLGGGLAFLGVLQDGFGLKWVVGNGFCDNCKTSGGVCGNDLNVTNGPVCICIDGTITNGTCSVKKKKLGAAIVIVASIGGVFLLGACIVLFLCVRRKRKLLSFKMDLEIEETYYNTHIFSYEELEEATHGFHGSRKLGNGGFGTVYKGKLRDGRTVAVKRLYENNCGLDQFMNEVEILSHVRHQNLVMLYGCTTRHSRELLLVYEYIPNGTLADHLHGSLTSKPALPWPTRMSIIIQIAEALAYLHSIEPQIIHRDIKTNNILVDNNFQVKVADFGISRLFPLDATHVSTVPQGTFGYLDPAYYHCFQLTDKSDVYSFGVVLIEIISSKPAVDITRHSDEISLANMAIAKIQKCQVGELVDPDLGYGSDLEITEMIDQVALLAFRCLLSDAEMRPGLKEVLPVLKRIKGEVDADDLNSSVKEESKSLSNAVLFLSDFVTETYSSNTSG